MMSDPANAVPVKLLGCLVKGPLGCFSFLLGAAVVFVVFFPPACGNIIEQKLGVWFDERHEGTLTVEKAWFGSLYGDQKIEGITLRDPLDSKVFEALLTAPSLDGLFMGDGSSDSWGPVEIFIENLDLVQYADGTTNLGRALARRETEASFEAEFDFGGGSEPVTLGPLSYDSNVLAIDVRLEIERLSWRSATEEALVLRDIECDAQILTRETSLRLELTGRGVFEGGKPDGLVFDLGIDSFERLGERRGFSPWSLNLELEDAPVLMVEALIGRVGQLAQPLNEVVSRLDVVLVSDAPGACRVAPCELRSGPGGANMKLTANWDMVTDELTADAEDAIVIGFPVDSWWTQEVVGVLLPLMDDVELASSNGYANLELQEFQIPLSGNPWDLAAHCTIKAGSFSYRLPAAVSSELLIERPGTHDGPLKLDFADGRAAFAGFRVPTAKSDLEVRGSLDPKARLYDLLVRTSEGEEFRIVGPRASPTLSRTD